MLRGRLTLRQYVTRAVRHNSLYVDFTKNKSIKRERERERVRVCAGCVFISERYIVRSTIGIIPAINANSRLSELDNVELWSRG